MPRSVRVLFVGDSVTAGFGLAGAPTFAELTSERLAERGLDVAVERSALDGADSAYLLKRFDRMVTAHDPDWVVFHVGLNDALPPAGRAPRRPAEFAANLLELIDRTMTIAARPVLVTPNPRYASVPQGRFARAERGDVMPIYVDVVRGLAEALQLPLIDAHRVFLADADGNELLQDGTHPTARGHELLADLLTEELLQLLDGPRTRVQS